MLFMYWLCACGGIQNTISDSLFSTKNLGHLGKGWIVRGVTGRRLDVTGAKLLFYPSWNILMCKLCVKQCGRLPGTDPTYEYYDVVINVMYHHRPMCMM